jgi:hypothetical protein
MIPISISDFASPDEHRTVRPLLLDMTVQRQASVLVS